MKILLANPRGFCAGVDRAIAIVNRALEVFGPPIYVRHQVVHNRFVVADLVNRGAHFVDELEEVPDGSVVVFSAHGVAKAVQQEAASRDLKVFDATCPLVTKVHMEVWRFSRMGYECILIGHAGHPEVAGTMGQYDQEQGKGIYLVENESDVGQLNIIDPNHLAYVTQTTLSVDDTKRIVTALEKRFPDICGPKKEDICYATQNRQNAVKQLSQVADLVLVVGSVTSSNSNRLRELAERFGIKAYLIDFADEIQPQWLVNIATVGVTAGASAPESLVQQVIARLQELGGNLSQELPGEREEVVFSLPKELRKDSIAVLNSIES